MFNFIFIHFGGKEIEFKEKQEVVQIEHMSATLFHLNQPVLMKE